MTPRVFISHAHEDKAAYSLLTAALDGSKVERWDVKQIQPGEQLTDALQKAVAFCDVCVFLATPRSIDSKWCLAELGAFWGTRKKVIVFLVDDSLGESDIPPQFRGNLWTDSVGEVIESIRNAEERGEPDNTMRKQLDLRGVIDNLPDAVFIKDELGRYVYFNTAFGKMFGKNKEDMLGKTDPDAFPNNMQAFHFVYTDNKAFFNDHRSRFFEFVKDHDDGEEKPYYTVKYKVKGEDGNSYVLGVCTNINRLKDDLFKTFCENLTFHNSAQYQAAKKIFANGIDHSIDHINPSRGEG